MVSVMLFTKDAERAQHDVLSLHDNFLNVLSFYLLYYYRDMFMKKADRMEIMGKPITVIKNS